MSIEAASNTDLEMCSRLRAAYLEAVATDDVVTIQCESRDEVYAIIASHPPANPHYWDNFGICWMATICVGGYLINLSWPHGA